MSIGQAVEVFQTTEYKAKKARKLLQQKGLLAEHDSNKENAFLMILLHLCNLSIKMTGFQDV